jgi:hypothetical protein
MTAEKVRMNYLLISVAECQDVGNKIFDSEVKRCSQTNGLTATKGRDTMPFVYRHKSRAIFKTIT